MQLLQTLTLRAAFASSTYLLPQRGGQNRLFCLRRWIHVCKYGLSAHVRLFLNCHGGRSWVFAPVIGFTCADPAFCPSGPSLILSRTAARTVARARSAQGLRNSPRDMPLFGAQHRQIAFSSHKSLRKRIRGYVLTRLLLFGKTEQPEINTACESVDS